MSSRLLSADVLAERLPEELPAGDTVLSGEPGARLCALLDTAAGGVGLWEMTPGTAQDVEDDEAFLVLSGSGSVAFEDGEVLALRPGVLVRLTAGQRTTWTVDVRLRKLYVAI